MCHVPCATNRLMTGTIVVPAFWRVEWCHAGPDRTSRSGAIPENAWTHILTDKHGPANYFSPTHRRKSSFIERSMLKHLNVHSLRFWMTQKVSSGRAGALSRRKLLRSMTEGPFHGAKGPSQGSHATSGPNHFVKGTPHAVQGHVNAASEGPHI